MADSGKTTDVRCSDIQAKKFRYPIPVFSSFVLIIVARNRDSDDCCVLVVLFLKFFSVHQIFDVPGPIFAKLCHTTRYVLK